MGTVPSSRELLWTPSEQRIQHSRMADYAAQVNRAQGASLVGYDELLRWSVGDLEQFWASIWSYFDVLSSAEPATVLGRRTMPGAVWFPGARLNFAENILRHAHHKRGPAIIGISEDREPVLLSAADLTRQVASLAAELRGLGVAPGDRVAAYLPNIPEAVVAQLATAAVGAIWSCCAPDFGTEGVLDRLRQIEPTVLIGVDGYRFGGRDVERLETLTELATALPSVCHTIVVQRLGRATPPPRMRRFAELVAGDPPPRYEQVPFDHPLWILYSSGTTGTPKGIVQSHGGILLEHLKSHALHFDTGPDDRVFIYATTSWMVWNMLITALGVGATIVTYDGHPTRPAVDQLFHLCAQYRVTRFGIGAAYLTGCQSAALRPGQRHDLTSLQSICSTGSPLPTSTWHWIYDAVKRDLLLGSDCGGTDVCTAFIGTNPLLPVYAGEMQAPYLGVRIDSWSPEAVSLIDEVGEMVITEPMPSMPVSFWNDPDGSRYRQAYFDVFPGIWRHGDWLTITRYGTYVVHGRSDSTINRGGVRMGSADVYAVVDKIPGVTSSLVIGAELEDGDYFMPLFVALSPDYELTGATVEQINDEIRARVSPRHVPDVIVAVPAIPMTITGKKLEVPIKRLLQGVPPERAVNRATVANPAALDWFLTYVRDYRARRSTAEAVQR